MPRLCSVLFALAALVVPAVGAEPVPLFDGKTFAGWEGDTAKTWKVADGVITAGSLDATVPRNDLL